MIRALGSLVTALGSLVATVIIFIAGCGGEIELNRFNSALEELYCYGNPDTSMICVPAQEVWDCEAMPGGEVKCTHTPDGQGGWSCSEQEGKVVCVKDSPDAFGGAGWECVSEGGATSCVSVGEVSEQDDSVSGFAPPGGGSWQCVADEFGIVCEGVLPAVDEEGTEGDEGDEDGKGGKEGEGDEQDKGERNKPNPGDFRTQTPGGWGAPASGNNAGAYRDAHFAEAFPGGLTVGCAGGHTALFTSAAAIEAFLPAGSTAGVLDQDYVDPLTTSGGVLAGHVVAFSLAVGFDDADPDFGASALSVRHLVASSGVCQGMTAGQILDLAQSVLGGCSTLATPSEITGCVDAINNNFVDGDRSNGYLVFP